MLFGNRSKQMKKMIPGESSVVLTQQEQNQFVGRRRSYVRCGHSAVPDIVRSPFPFVVLAWIDATAVRSRSLSLFARVRGRVSESA